VENCGKLGQQIVVVAAGRRANPGFCQANGDVEIALLRACSACAGDYEDPERTAWAVDDEAGEPRDEEDAKVDKFSAEEE
jgi:hypothetical protein